MRLYVLTRSAYGSAWDIEANRRRLTMTVGVCVASMRAQTDRDWTWIVAVDRDDPLLDERKAAFESAGVPVRFLEVSTSGKDRDAAAFALYSAPWRRFLGDRRSSIVAMTRLDDDDGLAPWVLGRVCELAPKVTRRTALVMPNGIRVYGGRCTVVTHETNAMQTLVTPPGDTMHVYSYKHRFVRKHARLFKADNRLAWVWARHEDSISGWRMAEVPIPEYFRAQFPIDWSLFGAPVARVSGGRRFR